MKTNSENTAAVQNLHNLDVVELRKLAGVKENSKLTKFQLIARIKEAQASGEKVETKTPKAEAGAENETQKTETKEEKPKDVVINIWDAEVGSVVRYKSSKKPYVVAEKVTEGEKPYLFLVSKTQQYNSTKKEFEVVLVKKGEGTLPQSFGDATLDECLKIATEHANKKLEIQKAREQKEAEKKAKAEAKTEEVAAEPTAEVETGEKK